MNQIALVGNLTKDPETRTTNNGNKVCNFTVACRRRVKNASGGYDSDFINCVAWRQTAEIVAQYFSKGSKIALTGSLQTRTYDAQDGSKRHVTEVLVDGVEFVQPKAQNGSKAASSASESVSRETSVDSVEDFGDLPF